MPHADRSPAPLLEEGAEIVHRGEVELALGHFRLDRAVGKDRVIRAARAVAADQPRRRLGMGDRLLDLPERRQVAGAVLVDGVLRRVLAAGSASAPTASFGRGGGGGCGDRMRVDERAAVLLVGQQRADLTPAPIRSTRTISAPIAATMQAALSAITPQPA